MEKKKNLQLENVSSILLGPLLFAACIFVLPKDLFTYAARTAIGTLCWMGVWWVAQPVHTGVTGLIPIVVNAIFGMIPMDAIISKYANETIMLLLGADLLTISWTVTGLDKRIALKSLYLIGPSLTQQLIVWFVASGILSMFLPNLVVCAMLTPIALSMLRYAGEGDLKTGKIAPIILVSIAWGTGIGGMGSPLGGAMNLVAIDYLEGLTGGEFFFTSWMIRMVPLLVIIMAFNIVCILIIKPKKVNLTGTRDYFQELYAGLGKISRDEIVCLVMFCIVMLLCFLRDLYAAYLPGLKPAYAFLLFGVLTFVLPKQGGGKLSKWENTSKEVSWGLIYMCGGGMAVGALLTGTGAIESFAAIINKLNLDGGFVTMLAIAAFTVMLSEISNNTSAAAISIPIVISICQGLHLNPIPYLYTTIAAFNCAYMLPTTTRAIPIGYGLSPKYLMQKGAVLSIGSIFVASLSGYLLMQIWPAFSTF